MDPAATDSDDDGGFNISAVRRDRRIPDLTGGGCGAPSTNSSSSFAGADIAESRGSGFADDGDDSDDDEIVSRAQSPQVFQTLQPAPVQKKKRKKAVSKGATPQTSSAGKKRKRGGDKPPVGPSGGAPGAARRKRPTAKKKETEDQGASSGDEYASNLLENYIGQIGACAALGLKASDVMNMEAWNAFTEEERDSLRVHLPPAVLVNPSPAALSSAPASSLVLSKEASPGEAEELVEYLLTGGSIFFGSPRDRMYERVAAGLTHPRVKRWRQRVSLIERRHHMTTLRDYHNSSVRQLAALKAPREATDDVLEFLGQLGGGISKAGDALLALPERVEPTAVAAGRSSSNEWDASRWRRVLDFRNQETERYNVPERAFMYRNPWGNSIVCPLKRGPALDGGRPREHDLLRNERPSHVTILCIVRDAASRLRGNRGSRADICDLLRDSQYLREGATFQQLNTVVSGALDRLHYETNAPVQFDPESKEWCYLHNDFRVDDFETPDWALAPGSARGKGAVIEHDSGGTAAGGQKRKKKRRRQ
jgi:hypothetical protein